MYELHVYFFGVPLKSQNVMKNSSLRIVLRFEARVVRQEGKVEAENLFSFFNVTEKKSAKELIDS